MVSEWAVESCRSTASPPIHRIRCIGSEQVSKFFSEAAVATGVRGQGIMNRGQGAGFPGGYYAQNVPHVSCGWFPWPGGHSCCIATYSNEWLFVGILWCTPSHAYCMGVLPWKQIVCIQRHLALHVQVFCKYQPSYVYSSIQPFSTMALAVQADVPPGQGNMPPIGTVQLHALMCRDLNLV